MEYLGISEKSSMIHKELSDFLKKTVAFYEFGNLNPDKIFFQINQVIESYSHSSEEVDLKIIKRHIIVRLKNIIKENLKEQKVEVLSKFIDQFVDENIHKTFNMLLYFLKQYNQILITEECQMLLAVNDNFKNMVASWVQEYGLKENEIPFELMYYNPNFITILKAYCFENNLSYTNILSKFGREKKNVKMSEKDLPPVGPSAYFGSISKVKLSKNQIKYLGFEILAGSDIAKEELIKHNILLSYSIAKKFYRGIVAFDDLLQSGNEGLIEAANKFDVTINENFITYATWWVRQKILRFLVTQLPVTVSQNAYDDLRQYNKAVNTFYLEKGYEPTLEQVSKQLNWTLEKTFDIKALLGKIVDLDTTSEVSDVVMRKSNVNPFESDLETIFDNIELRALIPKWFEAAGLSDIEKEVLIRHYGLEGHPETLEEIGKKHLVSRQRIDQIKTRALGKMKRVNEIQEYFAILGRETRAK